MALGFALTGCGPVPSEQGEATDPRALDATPDIARAVEIFAEITARWHPEAIRMCREQAAAKPEAPMPRAMMALATAQQPNRAARCCWEAVRRRGNGSAFTRGLIDALQEYFDVRQQPELVDARYTEAPPQERLDALRRQLKSLATRGARVYSATERALLQGLIGWDPGGAANLQAGAKPALANWRERLRSFNAYLAETGAIPPEVPGYRRVVQQILDLQADAATRASRPNLSRGDDDLRLARIPRHPDESDVIAGERPGGQRVGSDAWMPQVATGFELPSGLGGTRVFTPRSDQPTLVVFFLGFGCAHCVAQLRDLDPKAAAFREAGIEVLSIGTDSYQQVLAAQQAAMENDVDPLHFDVLCDPEGATFKQWGAWDTLTDEALHGTFLVDADGRVLWRDISERPFEQADWLLGECQRLLNAWR